MVQLFGEVGESPLHDQVDDLEESRSDLVKSSSEMELTTYLKSQCNIPLSYNPLQWWSDNAAKISLFSSRAKYCLACQGTSVATERVFSTAGDTITASRSYLIKKNADKLMFLQNNFNS